MNNSQQHRPILQLADGQLSVGQPQTVHLGENSWTRLLARRAKRTATCWSSAQQRTHPAEESLHTQVDGHLGSPFFPEGTQAGGDDGVSLTQLASTVRRTKKPS